MNIFGFEMHTVLLFLCLGNLFTAALLAIYPSETISRRTHNRFLVGKLLQSMAWLLLMLRGEIPDVFSAHVGNALLFAGFSMEALAFINVNGVKKYWEAFYAVLIVLFAILFWLLARTANQYIIFASWFSAVIFLSVAILLIYKTKKSRLRYSLSGLYIFCCLILTIRGVNACLQSGFKLMDSNIIQDITFISTFGIMMLSGSTFLLLQKERSDQLLKTANHELNELARTDSLTGLANRRTLTEYLEFFIPESRRRGEPLAVIMIDIDFFKNYNDLYGHSAGDECLIKVAQKIKQSCQRTTDMVVRYGGEEFVLVLINTDDTGAYIIAETVRQAIFHLAIPHAASNVSDRITLSLGVFSAIPVSDEHDLVWYIAEADHRLYEAKHTGRNRCIRT